MSEHRETLRDIRQRLECMDEVRDWPLLEELIGRSVLPDSKPCWEYVLHGCEAVGGRRQEALPGCAAIFCLFYAIHLVDDLLDDDPDGIFHRVGVGTAANVALAFQGMASRVIAESRLAPERQKRAQGAIGRMTLGTAFGQNLDAADLEGEEAYWRVVRHKTPPLFGCALELGALYGGACDEVAERVGSLGGALGEIVQINDDLGDAMAQPAKVDWLRRGTNLPILFARTAEHPERDSFEALAARVSQPAALAEAQEILVRSGAVSYCAYRIVEAYNQAIAEVHDWDLAVPGSLESLMQDQVEPLKDLLRLVGVESPEDLFVPSSRAA